MSHDLHRQDSEQYIVLDHIRVMLKMSDSSLPICQKCIFVLCAQFFFL